jgi:ribosome-binding protein aMBF1 (putative translation factor)
MTIADRSPGGHVPLTEELARIVRRADSLGLSRERVATALRISANDLAVIEQRNALTPEDSCDGQSGPHTA